MRTSLWLTTLAGLLAGPALAQAPPVVTGAPPAVTSPGDQAGGSATSPPPAEVPQSTGGQVMSQSPSGATSTLPTDKGTGGTGSGNKQ